MGKVKIQIAGIRTLADALECIKNGVDAIGLLVGQSHPSDDFITKELAYDIVKAIPPYQVTAMITHSESAEEIISLVKYIGVNCVQLHSYISESEVKKIHTAFPHIKLVRLIHIDGDEITNFEEMRFVDAFFTDSINKATGQFGGTGLTHNFEHDAMLSLKLTKPLIVAGGVNADNVGAVIKKVKPYGVDTNSGCKGTDGRMNYGKLKAFCDAVNKM